MATSRVTTAGTAAACAAELRRRGTIGAENSVVVVSTGHGPKQSFVSGEELATLPCPHARTTLENALDGGTGSAAC